MNRIQFGVLGPDDVRQLSVTTKATLTNDRQVSAGITKYETHVNGLPNYGGVNDPRMGSLQDKDSPGHFGHIELARPVFHIGFMKEALSVLRSVCFHCSALRVSRDDLKFKMAQRLKNGQMRLQAMHEICRNKKRCAFGDAEEMQRSVDELDLGLARRGDADEETSRGGCGGMQPTFVKKGLKIEVEFPASEALAGDRKRQLSALEVYNVFKNISDADVRALGLDPKWARPEWLLVKVLPVPPLHVRPSVALDGMSRSEDDITHQLVNIVKANLTLENCIRTGESSHIIAEFEQLLQYKVAALFDNEQTSMPQETQRSGKPLKTIRQRLKGKEGRIRGNLMGKRVDFSARTVITADPNLSIDQVGVPRSIALNLTVPTRVTPFNIQEMHELVARGPETHPGAKYVIRSDGNRIDLRYVKNKNDLVLEHGWTVERHLRDDDLIIFNRQPSLHKMSIMGHRVKVLDWSTFRLNLSVTSPYNADFDGDEMNLHVPQSLTARAEVQELMMVPKNIVSPQSNKPVMGIVQDSLLAAARMTKRDVFFERDLLFNLLMWVENWDGRVPAPAILKPKQLWSGKQIFSIICPEVNYEATGNTHPKDKSVANTLNGFDSRVLIHQGTLLQGIVDKKSLGTSGNSLIHVSWLERGWDITRIFMNQIQQVVNYWLLNNSFSIGVADTVADQPTMRTIEQTIDEAKSKVKDLVQQGQRGELEAQPGRTMIESFEQMVNRVLNQARQKAGLNVQETIDETNNVKAMVMAGSKGSDINISQIIAIVGQQNVEGKRIPYGFRRRTLPHFAKDDLGPESRGFVENSYLRGLSPQEFFFHAMGGREGLIDTAVKTSQTGYLQRRLVKAMESVMCQYDGTVRNSQGNVVQFLYGEDGMDAVWCVSECIRERSLAPAPDDWRVALRARPLLVARRRAGLRSRSSNRTRSTATSSTPCI